MKSSQIEKPKNDLQDNIEKSQQSINHILNIVDCLDNQLDQLHQLEKLSNQIDQTSESTQQIIKIIKQQKNELQSIDIAQNDLINKLSSISTNNEQIDNNTLILNQEESALLERIKIYTLDIQTGKNTCLTKSQTYFDLLTK